MPRRTHPPVRHRHTRAHIRFHRDRVVAKRARQFVEARQGSWSWNRFEQQRLEGPWGYLEDEQAWLGCRRARCGLCRPDKRWHGGADRLASERQWKRDAELV